MREKIAGVVRRELGDESLAQRVAAALTRELPGWLNETAPEGYFFGWEDGELRLHTGAWWQGSGPDSC